ncbi:hypothetical protein NMG60_11033826 [Bertholletia excelsa]
MAGAPTETPPLLVIISFSLTIFIFLTPVTGKEPNFIRRIDRNSLGLNEEKAHHIRLYWHDVLSGQNPTAVQVVPPPSNTSATSFGFMAMIDDALTVGPDLSSKMVGRAQGFYASASQKEVGLLMVMNFLFTEGNYNGSSITVLGRNAVFSPVREMAVMGGTGAFRWARGYAQAKTYKFTPTTGDAIVEYNVYVMHY